MKAFLLAAGKGTRMRPLTDTVPKCLLPIRGMPMLEIWLRICQRFGIDEVLLNLHGHVHRVRQFLRSRPGSQVRVQIVEEPALLGSAGTLRANRSWVASEPCLWVLYADVLATVDLKAMLQFHMARSPIATLGVCAVPDPQRCGVVTVSHDDRIEEFHEKPALPKSNLAFAGLMLGTPSMLESVPGKTPVDLGFDLLPALAGQMMAYRMDDYVLDMGTPENYRLAQATWPGI